MSAAIWFRKQAILRWCLKARYTTNLNGLTVIIMLSESMCNRLKSFRSFSQLWTSVQLSHKDGIRGKHSVSTPRNNTSWTYLRTAEQYANTTFRGHNHLITLINNPLSNEEHTLDSQLDVVDHLLKVLGSECTNWPPSLYYKNFITFLNSSSRRSFKYISKDDMLLLLSTVSNVKLNKTESQFICALDMECARRVLMWSADTCLLILDLWVALRGPKTSHTAFMKVLFKQWTYIVGCDKPQNVVQLLFYISYFRCAPQPLMLTLEKWLETFVDSLTNDDLRIVCQGFFQAKRKIESESILNNIAQRIMQTLNAHHLDNVSLTSYIKVLRHARYENRALCYQVMGYIKSNFELITNLMLCAHFAAFFASNRFDDVELFSEFETVLCNVCTEELNIIVKISNCSFDVPENYYFETTHLSNLSRMKDISRILWSMSEIVHSPTKRFIEIIPKYLRIRIQKDFNDLEKAYYVDCVHSLAIMGIFLNDLIEKFEYKPYTNFWTRKSMKQIDLLNESMKIEFHSKISTALIDASDNVCHGTHFTAVLDIIKMICSGNCDLFRCFRMKHIPNTGIELLMDDCGTLYNISKCSKGKYKVAVEVLEPSCCLQNGNQPTGIWVMKIRQLRHLGFNVVKILPDQVFNVENGTNFEKTLWFNKHVIEKVINDINHS